MFFLFFSYTSTTLRDRIVHALNDEYERALNDNLDNKMSTFERMVVKYPYQIRSFFNDTEFLKSMQVEEDFSICKFFHHREFIVAVREAEKIAQSGQRGHYFWRGYRGFVGPNLPPITLPGLKLRLMKALQRIPSLSNPEKMVTNNQINQTITMNIALHKFHFLVS